MKVDVGKPTSEMNVEKGQVDILSLKNNKIIIFTAVTELPMIIHLCNKSLLNMS